MPACNNQIAGVLTAWAVGWVLPKQAERAARGRDNAEAAHSAARDTIGSLEQRLKVGSLLPAEERSLLCPTPAVKGMLGFGLWAS